MLLPDKQFETGVPSVLGLLDHSSVWIETWALRKIERKHLECFETWFWRTERKSEQARYQMSLFVRIDEERSVLAIIRNTLRRNRLLDKIITEWIQCFQRRIHLVDDIKQKKRGAEGRNRNGERNLQCNSKDFPSGRTVNNNNNAHKHVQKSRVKLHVNKFRFINLSSGHKELPLSRSRICNKETSQLCNRHTDNVIITRKTGSFWTDSCQNFL